MYEVTGSELRAICISDWHLPEAKMKPREEDEYEDIPALLDTGCNSTCSTSQQLKRMKEAFDRPKDYKEEYRKEFFGIFVEHDETRLAEIPTLIDSALSLTIGPVA